MIRLAALALLLAPALVHADTVYKSVGPDGRVVYSQEPPAGNRLEKTMTFTNLPSTPLPASVIRYQDEMQKSMKKRFADSGSLASLPVLFSAAWCGYCKQAKAYLADKRIAFQEYDIDTPDGVQRFVESGGGRGVPVLLWNSQRVQGFSRPAYDALFKASR
jgi:glutaredoxin